MESQLTKETLTTTWITFNLNTMTQTADGKLGKRHGSRSIDRSLKTLDAFVE